VHGDDLELPLDSLRIRFYRGLSLEMGQHERAMNHVTGIDSYVGFFCFFFCLYGIGQLALRFNLDRNSTVEIQTTGIQSADLFQQITT
jgi:hypothetical protein